MNEWNIFIRTNGGKFIWTSERKWIWTNKI